MTAYYNEIDKNAAQWLRNLIASGHIAPGEVDERSIEDVCPNDIRRFAQCHFFAGVGVWSHALRQAGWSDDRPAWTGSCPCQPFSAAGKGGGFTDERHLWPAFHHLIKQCRPPVCFGEQVASKAVEPWVDLVHTDLEALGYAFGCVPFPSAGVGAPHIRDRAYWVADSIMQQRQDWKPRVCNVNDADGRVEGSAAVAGLCGDSGLAYAQQHDCGPHAKPTHHAESQANGPANWAGGCGGVSGGLADTESAGPSHRGSGSILTITAESSGNHADKRPGPTNGFWSAADWLGCRDGKWRPVEPGTFPLAHGAPARVGRLRAYGNAINSRAAQAFIESVM